MTRIGLFVPRDSDVSVVTEAVAAAAVVVGDDDVVAGMTHIVVVDVVEDQTTHYWPVVSEASAAEIHCDISPLSHQLSLTPL